VGVEDAIAGIIVLVHDSEVTEQVLEDRRHHPKRLASFHGGFPT